MHHFYLILFLVAISRSENYAKTDRAPYSGDAIVIKIPLERKEAV
jgi:hypothetical protein